MNTIYNPFSLQGKHILVTGASSGIGKTIAIECSKMGASLYITGRNEQRLKETFDKLYTPGKYIAADLDKKEEMDTLIQELTKLDGIVLCAGINELWPVNYVNKSKFEKIFTTNLYSPIELIKTIVKKKLYNINFSIVGITSIAGSEDIVVGNGIYGAGKSALKSFLKFCALEWASKNIRVNTVSPGLILTPMHPEDIKDSDIYKKIPLKRWGTPEDIAPAVIYLLSDSSLYLTGSDIKIDGGYTI